MPEELTQTAKGLRADVAALAPVMERHRLAVEKADRRSKASIVFGIIALAAVVAVMLYSVTTRNVATDQRHLSETFLADRAQARVGACIGDNVKTAAVRKAVQSSLAALIPSGSTVTPAQQALFDIYNRAVEAGLPYRDCSPAGIDAYYKSPPKDPAGG